MKSNLSHDLEFLIARILRSGVLLAGAFILIGWLYQLDVSENSISMLNEYNRVSFQNTLKEIWATKNWGLMVCYLGLVILITLPLIRVLMTGIIFLQMRAFKLACLTLLVLTGLILSFSLGFEI